MTTMATAHRDETRCPPAVLEPLFAALCANGFPAELSDLRLGRKFTFSFEEVDGVNVVNRIADAEESARAEVSQTGKPAEEVRK